MPAPDDQQRLEALKRFFVLDHPDTEDELARLVRVAAGLYGVAYAVLTLRDADGERVAAAHGLDRAALPAHAVFCERPVGPSIPLAVPDASQDERFAKNPLVHGPQRARFYAGVPLKSRDGFTLGTLALLDPTAQDLNGEGLAMLVDLAALVEPALNLQRARDAQAEAERQREAADQALRTTREALQAEQEAHQETRRAFEVVEEQHAALEAEREAARAERGVILTERDAALAERGATLAERDAFRDERDALAAERYTAAAERDVLAAERDAAVTERNAAAAERDALRMERNAMAAERDTAITERDAAVAARAAGGAAGGADAAGHEAVRRALARREALAVAALDAVGALAADPRQLNEALARVAPPTGATRAALVVRGEAGPTVRAAWHADGAALLAEPGDLLDAGALDVWADAHGVARLAALSLPGALVLLDAPAWEAEDEAAFSAAFAPLALAVRRLAAEAGDRAKGRFLTSMSHEVRTALTSILGYAEMLAEEVGAGAANPEAHTMVRTILTSGTRLLTTLNALMDVARLEAGGALALRPVDVGAAVEAAMAPFRAHAELRDLAFLATGTAAGAHAWADPTALDRVLSHLLTNAFTYTDQGGVRLRVHAEDDAVHVEVQDTGVGIDPGALPHLFDEFRREDGERDGKGAGLGLSITKRLVDLMGGQLSVTSLKGQGSLFRVALRAAPADAPAQPAVALTATPSGDGAPVGAAS